MDLDNIVEWVLFGLMLLVMATLVITVIAEKIRNFRFRRRK